MSFCQIMFQRSMSQSNQLRMSNRWKWKQRPPIKSTNNVKDRDATNVACTCSTYRNTNDVFMTFPARNNATNVTLFIQIDWNSWCTNIINTCHRDISVNFVISKSGEIFFLLNFRAFLWSFDFFFFYRTKGLLREHLYQKHYDGVYLYNCNFCQSQFNYRTSLILHQKRLHPNQYENAKQKRLAMRYKP